MDRQGTRKWLLSKMFPKKYGDKIVETRVLPVLKKAQADQSTFEAVTSLVSPGAANIERAGFAVQIQTRSEFDEYRQDKAVLVFAKVREEARNEGTRRSCEQSEPDRHGEDVK